MDRPREPSLSLSLSLSLPLVHFVHPSLPGLLSHSPLPHLFHSLVLPLSEFTHSLPSITPSLSISACYTSLSPGLSHLFSLCIPLVCLSIFPISTSSSLCYATSSTALSLSLRHSLVFSTKTSAPYLSQRGTAPRVTHPRSSLSLCFSLLYESAHEARARAFIHT